MPTPQQPHRPDGFDLLVADHLSNTYYDYEDHDAELRHVLRPWSQLSPEAKIGYIASGASLYQVPYDRFEQAARHAVGHQPLPAGEGAYLRLHMEYQRAMWDAELPAFPREQPVPKDDPHYDFLDSLDGVLHVKFERLLNDSMNGKQPFTDADGQMRHWPELSAEGKVEHIARLAAVLDQPLSRFTEAVHDALDGQTLRTDEHACLELNYCYALQLRGPSPHLLPTAHSAGTSPDHSIHDTAGQVGGFSDQLFGTASSQPDPQPPPDHAHQRQRTRKPTAGVAMNEQNIDSIAQKTARDILNRHAPDCLQRYQLRDAIARLVRQGIETGIRLYQMQQRAAGRITSPPMPAGTNANPSASPPAASSNT